MIGLDLMGAAEGLATQAIVVRIKSIDAVKLRAAIASDKSWGPALGPALALVDIAPKAALDAALPIAKKTLVDYGITADVAAADVPPATRSGESGFLLLVGAGGGIVLSAVVVGVYRLFKGRTS